MVRKTRHASSGSDDNREKTDSSNESDFDSEISDRTELSLALPQVLVVVQLFPFSLAATIAVFVTF